jgi:hypothetical protein
MIIDRKLNKKKKDKFKKKINKFKKKKNKKNLKMRETI